MHSHFRPCSRHTGSLRFKLLIFTLGVTIFTARFFTSLFRLSCKTTTSAPVFSHPATPFCLLYPITAPQPLQALPQSSRRFYYHGPSFLPSCPLSSLPPSLTLLLPSSHSPSPPQLPFHYLTSFPTPIQAHNHSALPPLSSALLSSLPSPSLSFPPTSSLSQSPLLALSLGPLSLPLSSPHALVSS